MTSQNNPESEFVDVGDVDLVAEGGIEVVTVFGDDVLIARIGERYYGVSDLCSHAAGWLDMGELFPDTFEIGCPLHEGRFDLRTGVPTREPCVVPIASYEVRVAGTRLLVGKQVGASHGTVANG